MLLEREEMLTEQDTVRARQGGSGNTGGRTTQ